MNNDQSQLICHSTDSVLLVIDIQTRLANAMPEKVMAHVEQNTARLLQAARLLSIPVITTEQYPKGLGDTLSGLQPHIQSTVLEKTCFSCGGAENFHHTLEAHGRQQVILTGMETHVCVLQTAIELMEAGYAVFVVEDAVCSRHKQHHKNARRRLQDLGAFISNHESVMFEWLRDASHPQFKAVTALLK